MANPNRVRRVADLVHQILSEALLKEISDPRLKMIHLTDVEVSRDLAHAKVYFGCVGDAGTVESAQEGLAKAKGFMRRLLAKKAELRITPELHFVHDDTVNKGRQLSSLIDEAVHTNRTAPEDEDTSTKNS